MTTNSSFEPHRDILRENFRREVRLQIYLPLLLGLLALAGIAVAVFVGVGGDSSALADISLLIVLMPFMILGLFPLALFVAIGWFGLPWLIQNSPIYLRQAADFMARLADQTNQVARYVRSPGEGVRDFIASLRRSAVKRAAGVGRGAK